MNVSTTLNHTFLAKRSVHLLGLVGFCFIAWHLPVPLGLSEQAWHLFAIFVTLILGAILKPMPMGALAFLAISVGTLTKTLTIEQALSSFSSSTVWLVVMAFLFSRGFIKTGLGQRIAYYLVTKVGHTSLKLGYCLALTECLLSPFIPSNSARGGAIIYPIALSLSEYFHSYPDNESRQKIGAFLMKVSFQANLVTSAMFMTAMAANGLIVDLLAQMNITLSWSTWALAGLLPGILSLLLLPWFIYKIYPPQITQTPQAPTLALEKLQKLGRVSQAEKIMLSTFALVLTLWIVGTVLNIHPTISAFLGISLLLVTNVLSFDDVLNEKNAWSTFIWLAVILMLSSHLNEFGVIAYFTEFMKGYIHNFNWPIGLCLIGLAYFYSHYLFGSMTAHITAMYSAFLMVLITLGAPPLLSALILACFSSLCGGLTHYGTAAAPIYFESNYISMREWWKIGGLISLLNIGVWGIVGPLWWHSLGLW